MSKQWFFEKERLKQLVTVFLSTGCDFEASFPENFKKPLQLYFHELIPFIQLGDGFHFLEAVFTKESVNFFRKNFSHLCMSAMRDRLLKLTKWSLQLKQRTSTHHFNSYQNLGVFIIVHEFVPQPTFVVNPRQGRLCSNLFWDNDTQILLRNTRH